MTTIHHCRRPQLQITAVSLFLQPILDFALRRPRSVNNDFCSHTGSVAMAPFVFSSSSDSDWSDSDDSSSSNYDAHPENGGRVILNINGNVRLL